MARLGFLTGNAGKLAEATALLGPLGIEVTSLTIDGVRPELIEPQAESLREVAAAKIDQAVSALAAAGRSDEFVLVEDSGLFIEALPAFPGVYSAHVLKSIGLDGILRLMAGRTDRCAHFMTVAALWDGETTHFFEGRCVGSITEAVRGADGFGYDPLFQPEGEDRTFAEMPRDEKAAMSHRGRALRQLVEHFESNSGRRHC